MTNEQQRVRAASLLRAIGHEFVARDLSGEDLDEIVAQTSTLLARLNSAPERVRTLTREARENFRMQVPDEDSAPQRQLFSDSVVSGGANPMGLGAYLWREGETAVIEASLGKAFEGAPGRAHGGVVAALIDETMGLVLAIHDVLAFTVQLDISYRALTPIGEPVISRAWLVSRSGRKITIDARVQAGDVVVAHATALFITVDPDKFLASLINS